MAYISENYSDTRILQQLRKLRPEIELGDRVRVADVDAQPGDPVGVIKVTLAFAVNPEEWRQILDNSRI